VDNVDADGALEDDDDAAEARSALCKSVKEVTRICFED